MIMKKDLIYEDNNPDNPIGNRKIQLSRIDPASSFKELLTQYIFLSDYASSYVTKVFLYSQKTGKPSCWEHIPQFDSVMTVGLYDKDPYYDYSGTLKATLEFQELLKNDLANKNAENLIFNNRYFLIRNYEEYSYERGKYMVPSVEEVIFHNMDLCL